MPIIINGETLPDGLVEQEFQAIKAHYERMGSISCCERDAEFRGYAEENLIARFLINQEAARRYPDVSREEIDAGLARLDEEHGSRAAMMAHLGVSKEEMPMLEAEIATGARVDRMLQAEWGEEAPATDEAVREFIAAHQEDYLTAEEIRVTHIFRQVEKVEDRESTYQQLCSVRREARGGGDFEVLALAHTDKEDKQVDLGWFRRGEHMEEFEIIVFSLEEGEISPVFASHWGFHLAKVTGHRPRVPRPFEEVAEAVRERMTAEHRQQRTRALVEELKAKAEIIRGGGVED